MTGVLPATLRAWEKRYGVPAPARTGSRYRLYSEADVAQIRWMKAQTEQGVPAARAAELARQRSAGPPEGREAGHSAPGVVGAGWTARLKAACLGFDENQAHAAVREAGNAMPRLRVLREIVLPTVADIGRDWEVGRATIAQEHFASRYARSFAERLLGSYPQQNDMTALVLACAPGELHELGLLALAVELRSRSVRIVYLGADVPVRDVLGTLESTGAAGAVVAVTLTQRIEPWARAGDDLRRTLLEQNAEILWGGPGAVAATARELPGEVALTIEEAIDACLGFVRARSPGHTPGER